MTQQHGIRMDHYSGAAVEAAKVAPAAGVSGAKLMGLPVNDWVAWLTLIYIIGLLIHQSFKHYQAIKAGITRFKQWRAENRKQGRNRKQRGVAHPRMLIGGTVVASALLIASPVIMEFEGKENAAYLDAVGIPTICYGHTATAEPGQTASDEQCQALLNTDMRYALASMTHCIRKPLEPHEWAAVTSWAYNVGTNAACKSTLVRMINNGNSASEWCNQLSRWKYAGGRELKGLVRRREAELELCLGNRGSELAEAGFVALKPLLSGSRSE